MTKTNEANHHYFATTAFNWAVGATRAEAIANVARMAGAETIKRNVKANAGLYCWSCRVGLPQSAHYDINYYQPQFITKDGKRTEERVPISKVVEAGIQNTKGHVTIIDREEEQS